MQGLSRLVQRLEYNNQTQMGECLRWKPVLTKKKDPHSFQYDNFVR